MSSTLPQTKYFNQTWAIPGTQWTLQGHSRALERTGFWIREARIVLDAGVDLPAPESRPPNMILVTHTHIDHANAIPMLFRHTTDDSITHVFVPLPLMHRLREFAQLSWAMKVDEHNPLPDFYKAPLAIEPPPVPGCEIVDGPRRWRPVEGGLTLAKCPGQNYTVRTVQLFHTVTTVGYIITETKNKLRPEFAGENKREVGERVKAAKARGESTTMEVESFILAFLCDTSIKVFYTEPQATELIYKCETVIVECTYLEAEMKTEADRRGHIVWTDLAEIVRAQPQVCWVLIHFSLRYSDEAIREYFDKTGGGIGLVRDSGDAAGAKKRKASVVLWLDTGVTEYVFSSAADLEK